MENFLYFTEIIYFKYKDRCYTWWYHAKRTLYGSRDVGEGSARLRESSMIRVCHTCSLGNCTHSTCRMIKTNLLRMQEIQDEDQRITVKFSLCGEHKWHVTSMNDERNLVINWLDCTSLTLNNLDYFFLINDWSAILLCLPCVIFHEYMCGFLLFTEFWCFTMRFSGCYEILL